MRSKITDFLTLWFTNKTKKNYFYKTGFLQIRLQKIFFPSCFSDLFYESSVYDVNGFAACFEQEILSSKKIDIIVFR